MLLAVPSIASSFARHDMAARPLQPKNQLTFAIRRGRCHDRFISLRAACSQRNALPIDKHRGSYGLELRLEVTLSGPGCADSPRGGAGGLLLVPVAGAVVHRYGMDVTNRYPRR